MTTFTNVSYDQFKAVVAEFFSDKDATLEEVQAGAKCVVLHYFGHNDWTESQINDSIILLEMVGKIEVEKFILTNTMH